MRRRLSPLLLVALVALVRCSGSGSAHSGAPVADGAVDATPRDGGAKDAKPAAEAAPTDAKPSGDAVAQRESGAALDGGLSLYGDRNLGTVAAYPSAALVQNGGRVIDVKNPPPGSGIHPAMGDGTTDDTAALEDAYDFLKAAFVDSGAADSQPYWVYLPDGTYKVSSTVIYRGASLEPTTGFDWYDVTQVRFVGQSREHTTLQLADGSPGFQDATKPSYVLAFQHPDTRFNNIPGANLLENLTIDTGKNNPGAIGLFFQGANLSVMTNVKVVSGDGAARCGIALPIGSVQGSYHDVTVEGFAYGICQTQNSEVAESFEHVTLSGQSLAGAYVSGGGLVLRAAEIDETATKVPAVLVDQAGAQVTVVDSELRGAAGSKAIALTMAGPEVLFARNVKVLGFDPSVWKADAAVSTGDIAEYLSDALVTLSPGQPTHSMPLPVKDTPIVPWFDPTSDWADVGDYGAKGDGTTDDSAAVESALGSGHPVVYFPKRKYFVTKAMTVPASVKRIDGLFATVCSAAMVDTNSCSTPGGSLQFIVNAASESPLLVRGFNGYGGITLEASRDVIVQYYSGGFSNRTTGPVNLYLENVANMGAGETFNVAGQSTFARGLNDEQGSGPNADMQVGGGSLWVLSFKTENKPVNVLRATGGAFVEVLGGYNNVTVNPGATPLILNDGANVSFSGFTNFSCSEVTTAIQEGHDAGIHRALPASLPSRGYDTDCYVIPLYVGYQRDAGP